MVNVLLVTDVVARIGVVAGRCSLLGKVKLLLSHLFWGHLTFSLCLTEKKLEMVVKGSAVNDAGRSLFHG